MKKLLFLLLIPFLFGFTYMEIPVERYAYQDGGVWRGDTITSTAFHQGDGIAYQFNLAEDSVFSSFEGWMGQVLQPGSTGQHNIELYQHSYVAPEDSPYPGRETPINSLFSKSFMVEGDEFGWHGVETDPMYLSKGDYWLGVTGGYADGTYVNPGVRLRTSDQLATIHNPEPATMAMMAGGLPLLLRRRKKVA